MKIKKGDTIIVTAGKDRGRQGQVVRTFPKTTAILVPGINQYKKHVKPQKGAGGNRPGEIMTLDRPLDISKVALICPKCKQATRIGYSVANGIKNRICKKCDNLIDAKMPITKVVKKKEKK